MALEIVQKRIAGSRAAGYENPRHGRTGNFEADQGNRPDIKVIMMTAYGELDMIKEATRPGALMHFTKPFDIDEMRMAVNMHARRSPVDRIASGAIG